MKASKYHPKKSINTQPGNHRTKRDLVKLADNLSKGVYKKESEQREKILQMIVNELNGTAESPP